MANMKSLRNGHSNGNILLSTPLSTHQSRFTRSQRPEARNYLEANWSPLINSYRSGHSRTAHNLPVHVRKEPTYSHCGQQPQTVEHLLYKCQVGTRFTGSMMQLHQLQDGELATDWTGYQSYHAGARIHAKKSRPK